MPYNLHGSLGIATTRNCTHFHEIGFVVAGGGVFIHIISTKGINQKKEKSLVLCIQKNLMHKRQVLFRVGAIPRLPICTVFFCKYGADLMRILFG